MKLLMFAVHDNKAGAFLAPWFMPNRAMAVRVFTDCAADKEHMFGKHPEDYALFCLGEFDDNTARFVQLDVPENLGLAAGYRVNALPFPVNPSVIPPSLRGNGEDPNHQEIN